MFLTHQITDINKLTAKASGDTFIGVLQAATKKNRSQCRTVSYVYIHTHTSRHKKAIETDTVMFKLLLKFIILSRRLFLILLSCKIAHTYAYSYHIILFASMHVE